MAGEHDTKLGRPAELVPHVSDDIATCSFVPFRFRGRQIALDYGCLVEVLGPAITKPMLTNP
jgi:hypothetical protein